MKQPKPTRKSVLEEMLAQNKNQLDAEQDRMIKKVLTEKHQLIQEMLDELPHYVWPEPSLPSYFSDRRRYYQIFLGSPSGWAGDMTHTEDPHPYIKWVNFKVENSEQDEWSGYGSEMRLMLEIEHFLGIEWFVNGKYDEERHKRYDLCLPTVMRATVDSSSHMIVALQWADAWKTVRWREVAIPTDILKRYTDLVKWGDRWKPDFTALDMPANSLLFFRKVNYPDGRVMHICLESGEDECWLFGRLLDRAGNELVSDYFRFFPTVFTLQYGDTLYQAMLREDKQYAKK